jgi:preprotein translocase subunit YajC
MQATLATILLQAAGPGGGGMMPIFLMGGMFIVMYFFMIRPQQKKAKDQKSFADSIAVDENVVTTAGIHGRINRINDDGTLQLDIARGTFITIERSAVSMEMTAAKRKKSETPVVVSSATVSK